MSLSNYKSIKTTRTLLRRLRDRAAVRKEIMVQTGDQSMRHAADHLGLAISAMEDVEFHLSEAARYEKESRKR